MKNLIKIIIVLVLLVFPVKLWAGAQTVSGKTTTEVITSVRYYINENTASFWSDAELLSYINDATTNIIGLSGCSEQLERFPITTGTTEYTLTENYMGIKEVLYISKTGVTDYKSLLRGDITKVGHASSGTFNDPVYYYEFNGKVGLYPLEDTATGSTIFVYLNSMPASLTSGSTITTPAFFDRAIIFYTTAQALYKAKLFQSANLFMTQYYFDIKFYVENIMKPAENLIGVGSR